jgi:hypothetical protein
VGLEALCTARFGKKTSKGKALLESEALVFRGEFRLAIPFRAMQSVKAVGGELRVEFAEGTASCALGPQAEKWAEKILHPKSLIDKLGVKPGAAISVLGVRDGDFLRRLEGRTKQIATARPRKDSDFIFLAAEVNADLPRLKSLVPFLKKTGAIWVIYPKGRPEITQAEVMAAAKQAGLVDVKVASFSATHTALKLVIPVARR